MDKTRFEKIKSECRKKNITITDAFVDAYHHNISREERRKVLAFIEEQGNLFAKVQTNINQFAKVANSQKYIADAEIRHFNQLCNRVIELKEDQNKVFNKIYDLLSQTIRKPQPDDCENS